MKRVINHRPLSEDPDDQHLRVFLTDLGASSKKRYVTSLHNSYDGPFPNNGRYVGFAACYFEDLEGARKDFLTRDISQYNRVGVLEKISKPSIAKVESKGVDNKIMKVKLVNVRHGKNRIIFANLIDAENGNLIIASTLSYILEILDERGYEIVK